MENHLIKKIGFGADIPENVTIGVPGENGPLGILVTSRQHNSSRAQQTPQGTFTPLMSGLGRGQCGDDRLKCVSVQCYQE